MLLPYSHVINFSTNRNESKNWIRIKKILHLHYRATTT